MKYDTGGKELVSLFSPFSCNKVPGSFLAEKGCTNRDAVCFLVFKQDNEFILQTMVGEPTLITFAK